MGETLMVSSCGAGGGVLSRGLGPPLVEVTDHLSVVDDRVPENVAGHPANELTRLGIVLVEQNIPDQSDWTLLLGSLSNSDRSHRPHFRDCYFFDIVPHSAS